MAKDDKPNEEEVVPESQEEVTPEPKEESPEPDETPKEEPKEQAPEENPKEETPEEPRAEEPEAPTEEEKPISRREQLRVNDLLKKYGPPKEKAPLTNAPDFRDKVQADEEVYKTLEETATNFGQEQYSQGLEQAKFYKWDTLLNVDDPQVRTKYPEFDPSNKEKFHSVLANAMYTKYLRAVGYDAGDPQRGIPETVQNPNIRYLDYVEAEMEFADELAAQRVEKTTQNIAKQAAQTGLRPDGSSPTRLNLNKNAEDMTDEELNAVISQSIKK